MQYDIIGDIHGDARKLVALLAKMGYRDTSGAWRHPERQAIFVGDFIDRGPDNVAACQIVRRMTDAGTALAVMGNHEFNAIAWFTEDVSAAGQHLRRHTDQNRAQHKDFLAEVEHTPLHRELIDWFLTLPLWLDLAQIRIIHACWHPGYIDEIRSHLQPDCRLDLNLMAAASDPDAMAFRTVEGLLKGLETPLPNGATFHDKSGHARNKVRLRWWDQNADTFPTAALLDAPTCATLPALDIPAKFRIGYTDDKPVFFGHYSMSGSPRVLAPHVACVDYFDKLDNPLVAYQWDGEPELDDGKFVLV
ncbi:putative phosphatase [Oxalobacteraceae bacterium IMCC9480]|nr:putative phosphatase [Oxalobacteraceae bacterium IMCC9480]